MRMCFEFFQNVHQITFYFCFFSVCVISPVRYHFTGKIDDGNDDDDSESSLIHLVKRIVEGSGDGDNHSAPERTNVYLWMYVLFTYFFTFIAIKMAVAETKHVVSTRQAYLGKQNTITDRTIRLSGIPIELRDSEALKTRIEQLKIGTVSSITICRVGSFEQAISLSEENTQKPGIKIFRMSKRAPYSTTIFGELSFIGKRAIRRSYTWRKCSIKQ